MKKISLVLCVAMVLAMFTSFGVFAADLPEFYVEDATVTPGAEFTAKLGVKGLTADTAMDTFGAIMTYPEGFTYVSSDATAAVKDVCKITIDGTEEATYFIEHDADARTITLVAVVNTVDIATTGITTDGILLEAKFTAPAEADFAAAGYTFEADALESGFVDMTGETVEVTVTDGNVTKTVSVLVGDVTKVVTVLKGDVNGDGKLSKADRAYIIRYYEGWEGYEEINELAADVNGDGKLSKADRAYIIRYFENWDGYTIEN